MYNDDYATCKETFATLRIYPGDVDPQTVTERLGLTPSRWQRCGEVPPNSTRKLPARISACFLTSEQQVRSNDARRHIDWILDRVSPSSKALLTLQEAGCRMDITCFWLSRDGHGGPALSPCQMKRLAELNLELSFDIYGPFNEEPAQHPPAT